MTDHELLAVLRQANLNPRRQNGQWLCRCPSHDDRSPSLSIRTTPEGRILAYCHAGCAFFEIIAALGLIGGSRPKITPLPPRIYEPPVADTAMLAEWDRIRQCGESVEDQERSLGIPLGGLARIGAVWATTIGALAAPMFDQPNGCTIGVRLRNETGKWAVTGSHNGLFAPNEFAGEGPLFMPEGFTDTGALCGLGLDAVGRPAVMGGRELARRFAKQIHGREIVVVGDRDQHGRGEKGARILANELAHDGGRIAVLMPPPAYKDVRDWVRDGADRETILFAAAHAESL